MALFEKRLFLKKMKPLNEYMTIRLTLPYSRKSHFSLVFKPVFEFSGKTRSKTQFKPYCRGHKGGTPLRASLRPAMSAGLFFPGYVSTGTVF
jgi:hypothetical protein